MLSLED